MSTQVMTTKARPECGDGTVRTQTAWWFRPLRWLFPQQTSTRLCKTCGWTGFVFLR